MKFGPYYEKKEEKAVADRFIGWSFERSKVIVKKFLIKEHNSRRLVSLDQVAWKMILVDSVWKFKQNLCFVFLQQKLPISSISIAAFTIYLPHEITEHFVDLELT